MSLLLERIAELQKVFRVFYAIIYSTHWVNCIFKIMLEFMEVACSTPPLTELGIQPLLDLECHIQI